MLVLFFFLYICRAFPLNINLFLKKWQNSIMIFREVRTVKDNHILVCVSLEKQQYLCFHENACQTNVFYFPNRLIILKCVFFQIFKCRINKKAHTESVSKINTYNRYKLNLVQFKKNDMANESIKRPK